MAARTKAQSWAVSGSPRNIAMEASEPELKATIKIGSMLVSTEG